MFGGFGIDVVAGDAGRDTLEGGQDGDIVRGGSGEDLVYGGFGDDFLIGDEPGSPGFADVLYGGAGRDLIFAGRGQDILYGDTSDGPSAGPTSPEERGGDIFQFNPGDSVVGAADRILDFDVRRDTIELVTPGGTAWNFRTAVALNEAEAGNLSSQQLDSDAGGSVIYSAVRVGRDTFLFIDSDSDGRADDEILLVGVNDLTFNSIRNEL